jgi:hypothetical protein
VASVLCGDWMAFGDVCHCRRERHHYTVGLQLDQALIGLGELAPYFVWA